MDDKTANDVELSKRNIKNIMHRVNSRVSDDAATHLAYELERRVTLTTRAAQVVANADGRKTIREDDIRRAVRINQIMNEADKNE